MSDLSLHIEGPQAEATAKALEAFFAETFSAKPSRELSPSISDTEKADPVAIAALILSIPGALLQAMDLAERIKLKEKVARLIERARQERAERNTRIWLQRKNAGPLALDQAQPADILAITNDTQQI